MTVSTRVGICYGPALGMGFSCHLVEAFTQHLTVEHYHGAYRRIRTGESQTMPGELKRMLHPLLMFLFLHGAYQPLD